MATAAHGEAVTWAEGAESSLAGAAAGALPAAAEAVAGWTTAGGSMVDVAAATAAVALAKAQGRAATAAEVADYLVWWTGLPVQTEPIM